MQITAINNFGKIKIQNNINNRSGVGKVINSQKGDTVSFTALSSIESKVETVQKSYQKEIGGLRAERNSTIIKNNREFFNEAEKVRGFNDSFHRFVKGKIDYVEATDAFKKTSEYKALDITDFFRRMFRAIAAPVEKEYSIPNVIAVVSEDKNKSNNFIDAILYNLKAEKVLPVPEDKSVFEHMQTFGREVLVDIETVPDKFSNVDDLQSAIYESLERAEQKFKDSDIRTILHIENIEPVISKENTTGNISCMKDLLSSSWDDYHTMMVFGVTDPQKCDPGIMCTHRIAYSFDLDKLGITEKEIKKLNRGRNTLEPLIERVTPIYKRNYDRYLELGSEIKELQGECKREVRSTIKRMKENPIEKVADEIKNKGEDVIEKGFSSFKKRPFGAALAIAVGVGACIAYKKYVKGKAEKIASQQKQVEPQPIKNTANATINIPAYKTSNIFSEFQKIG